MVLGVAWYLTTEQYNTHMRHGPAQRSQMRMQQPEVRRSKNKGESHGKALAAEVALLRHELSTNPTSIKVIDNGDDWFIDDEVKLYCKNTFDLELPPAQEVPGEDGTEGEGGGGQAS
jgi:hypothetical protein